MAKDSIEDLVVVMVDTNLVEEPPWNPNEQSPEVFNELVKNIRETKFKEPVLIAPRKDKEGHFFSISGSHRVKAARVIGLKKIPCIIETGWDEDMQKFQNMRFNVIKGKLDPVRFTKMFLGLSAKYGEDATKAMMAFVDKAAFEQVFLTTKASLPAEMQKALNDAKGEIKTIDALASVLNEMFAKYGNTVEKNYMVFSFGGQSHLWIIMDDQTKKLVDTMKKTALETGKNINDVFRDTMMGGPSI